MGDRPEGLVTLLKAQHSSSTGLPEKLQKIYCLKSNGKKRLSLCNISLQQSPLAWLCQKWLSPMGLAAPGASFLHANLQGIGPTKQLPQPILSEQLAEVAASAECDRL